jgi:predicted ArsR family transcriptional regulator
MQSGALDQDTRERILAYLQKNHLATVPELSKLWGFTRANIRYHLNQFIQEGLVVLADPSANRPGNRGRPTQYYRLSTPSLSQNYFNLARALLAIVAPKGLESLPHTGVAEIAAQMATSPPEQHNLSRRMNQVIQELSKQNYQARWEASADGPEVRFFNCPYASLLSVEPGLCLLDKYLLERSIGLAVNQTAQINLIRGVPKCCIFRVLIHQKPEPLPFLANNTSGLTMPT